MSSDRKRFARLAALIALITLGVGAGGWWVFARFVAAEGETRTAVTEAAVIAPAAGGAPAAEDPALSEAVVVGVEGLVERSTDGGEWASVQKGERLRANDAIRTAANARADLEIDGKSSVTITPSSELGIQEVSRAVHRFKLVRGQMAVDYEADGSRTLRVEGEGAVAQSTGAKFSVLASGGSFAVATVTGKVELEAGGRTVAVGSGEQSIARAGGPPSLAVPIPAQVLLKVAAAKKVKSGCPPIQGVAERGSEVRVDGVRVPLDAKGAFTYQAPNDGRLQVKVSTRDVAGRTQERVVACRRRANPKIDDFAIRWRAPRQN